MSKRTLSLISALILSLGLGGCASNAQNKQDPYESYNRGVYRFNETVYRYTFRPLSKAYTTVTPKIFRTTTGNVLNNIGTVPDMANDMLQGNRHLFWNDLKRLFFNTTLGGLGLIDVAGKAKIYSHPQNFGYTLSKWGMPEGSFFMLPLLGPGTTTGTIGKIPDYFMDPMDYYSFKPKRDKYYVMGIKYLNLASTMLPRQDLITKDAIDPYAALRSAFMQNNAYNIRYIKHDGQIPPPQYKNNKSIPEDNGAAI